MTFEDVTQSRRAQDRVVFLARHDAMTGLPNRVQLAESAAGAPRGRRELRAAVPRPRPLQGGERHVWASMRRRVAAPGRQPPAQLRPSDRRRLAPWRRRIRFHSGRRSRPRRGRPRGQAHRRLSRRALRAGRTPCLDRRQHRHRASRPSMASNSRRCSGARTPPFTRSKKSGRGAWRMFDDQIDRELQNRRVMEIELRAALGNGELEVVYQPICDLADGKGQRVRSPPALEPSRPRQNRARRLHRALRGSRA